MVVVPKANGQVRICVDLTKLNENVRRAPHAAVSGTSASSNRRCQTLFKTRCEFWLLANRALLLIWQASLPLGITSAPEHFQRRMSELQQGIDGVVVLVDNTLITGKSTTAALLKAGLTLGVHLTKILGSNSLSQRCQTRPNKSEEMTPPRNVSELRLLGSKVTCLAENTKPLRDLLSKKNH